MLQGDGPITQVLWGDLGNKIRVESTLWKMAPSSRVLSRMQVHCQQPVIHHFSISCIFQGRSQLHPALCWFSPHLGDDRRFLCCAAVKYTWRGSSLPCVSSLRRLTSRPTRCSPMWENTGFCCHVLSRGADSKATCGQVGKAPKQVRNCVKVEGCCGHASNCTKD